MENGRLMTVLLFATGVVVGMNWGKIRKWLPKAKEQVVEAVESAKETVTDTTKRLFGGRAPRGRRATA